ncbi:MAG: YjgP/YjgQ family permease [Candidatus Omnitrophica bacterium]|nr:YjgP/YjgQ family permease [Candidatus Omnitrophota bacterium]
MRIIDRYILKSIVTIFLGGLLAFFFLYVIVDILSHLEEFLRDKVAFDIIRDYYISFLPIIFVQTAPVAFLLAVLFTFSRLNVNNEIVAIRSAGINIWQLVRQTIFLACLISIIIFWVNEKVIPPAMQLSDKIKTEQIEGKKHTSQKDKINNLAYFGLNNRLFFINAFIPKELSMEGITVLEQDKNQELRKKIFALKGTWQKDQWTFFGTQIFSYDGTGNETSEFLEEKVMDIPETPEDFLKQRIQVDYMNIKQLSNYLSKLSDSGAKTVIRNMKVDIQQRYAYPFGTLVVVFMGLPFGLMIRKRKGMTFASFGICIAVGFLYYLVNAVSIALGKSGVFEPIISAWFANILFFMIALILLKKIT